MSMYCAVCKGEFPHDEFEYRSGFIYHLDHPRLGAPSYAQNGPSKAPAAPERASDWSDLEERLEEAVRSLQVLIDDRRGYPSREALWETARLKGKMEGVKLALSYMQEYK